MADWSVIRAPLGVLVIAAASASLAGCVGGTTYGTGVSQERQLVKDLSGMVSLRTKQEQPRIDYVNRPDLVMPATTAALPQPLEEEQATDQVSDVDWPETPEARIARVQAAAGEVDPESGDIIGGNPTERTAGIRMEDPGRFEHDDLLDVHGYKRRDQIKPETANRVRELKDKLALSNGPTRKYLTEPPNQYRTPSETAPVDELGLPEAQKDTAELSRLERERRSRAGTWME